MYKSISVVVLLSLLLVGCNLPEPIITDNSTTVVPIVIETVVPTIVPVNLDFTEDPTKEDVLPNILTYLDKRDFEKEIFLEIPTLSIDTELKIVCGDEGDTYTFSILHEAPIWLCSDASPYLSNIGAYGASIILGHRQWGVMPKVFAKLDKMKYEDRVIVKSSTLNLNYKVREIVEVKPEDLWQEIAKYHVEGTENDESFLILITCTPYGTDKMRMMVILERIIQNE